MTMLKKFRIAYGYEQQKAAAKFFISPGYLSDLEYGLKKPSPKLARAIADIFGAKVEAVFPDGCAEKVCRQRKVDSYYMPADTPVPDPRYYLLCPKCGAQGIYCSCYSCGRELEMMEGARV